MLLTICAVFVITLSTRVVADTVDIGQALAVDFKGRIYVGGRFNAVGDLTTGGQNVEAFNIARWDPTAKRWEALPGGSLVANQSGVGNVSALAADSTGNTIYVGGNFNKILEDGNLTTITNFASYDVSNESWTSLGTVFGSINEIKSEGIDAAVIVGNITAGDGIESRNIVRWTGTTFEAVLSDNLGGSNSPGVSGQGLFSVLVESPGNYLVGGNFTISIFDPPQCNPFGLSSVESLARLDGNLLPPCSTDQNCSMNFFGTPITPRVTAIAKLGGESFIGGNFSHMLCGKGGALTPVANIARDNSTGAWIALDDPSMPGDGVSGLAGTKLDVLDIASITDDNTVIVAGQFLKAESLLVNSIARWDNSGSKWIALQGSNPEPGVFFSFEKTAGRVNALHYDATFNRVYVAGRFSEAGGKNLGQLGGMGGIAYYQFSKSDPDLEGWFALTHTPVPLDLILNANDGSPLRGENLQETRPSQAQTVTFTEENDTTRIIDVSLTNISGTEQSFALFIKLTGVGWDILALLDGVNISDSINFNSPVFTDQIPAGESADLFLQIVATDLSSGEAVINVFGFDLESFPAFGLPADAVSIVAQRDCDDNFQADVNQIAVDRSLDTNSNSVLDSCDIADRSFSDLDANGVPDEVEETRQNQPELLESHALPIPGLGVPVEVLAGDTNGDGKIDITILQTDDTGQSKVIVTKTGEDGQLQPPEVVCEGTEFIIHQIARADLDCDGKDELIKHELSNLKSSLSVTFNNGKSFKTLFGIDIQVVGKIAIKDLNNDSKLDVVILIDAGNGVKLIQAFENKGVDSNDKWQGFEMKEAKVLTEEASDEITSVAIANAFNPSPGLPDVIVASKNQTIAFEQDGPFVFTRVPTPLSTNGNLSDAGSSEAPLIKVGQATRDLGNDGLTDFLSFKKEFDIIVNEFGETIGEIVTVSSIKIVLLELSTASGTPIEIPFEMGNPFSNPDKLTCNSLELADVVPTPKGSVGGLFLDIIWTAVDASGQKVAVIFTNLGVDADGFHRGFSAGEPVVIKPGFVVSDAQSKRVTAVLVQPEAATAVTNAVPVPPKAVFADVNDDGRADLVVVDHETEQISVRLNTLPDKDPTATVTINDNIGPVTIKPGDPVSIKVSLDPGSRLGDLADWWAGIVTPFGIFSLVITLDNSGELVLDYVPIGFNIQDLKPTISADLGEVPLFDLPPFEILSITTEISIPEGEYTPFIAVDMTRNNTVDLDPEQLFFDTATLIINQTDNNQLTSVRQNTGSNLRSINSKRSFMDKLRNRQGKTVFSNKKVLIDILNNYNRVNDVTIEGFTKSR